MATLKQWVSAARPRTLAAAAAPVLVGSAAVFQALATANASAIASAVAGTTVGAATTTSATTTSATTTAATAISALGLPITAATEFHLGRALLALGVALALQVGVNYANDYSDGVRGTDLDRKGPTRLTASRAAPPKAVRTAAFASFGIAGLLGLWLVALTGQWWLLAVGGAAVLAAWFYTGGKKPYGYSGFGEVGVFAFFGLVATLGTTYTQIGRLTLGAVLGAIGVGLLACAILMINNIRDIPTDRLAGKRTLAVRLGDRKARTCYQAFLVGALLAGLAAAVWVSPWAWALLLLVGPAIVLTIPVRLGATGQALIPVLAGTSALELGYAIILAAAFVLA